MKKIALITGASSGLGLELIKNINSQFPDISEIWAVQRRDVNFDTIKIPVRSICLDLTSKDSYESLSQLLNEEKPQIELLINNAGFGKIGNVAESEYSNQALMVDLNCRALSVITTLCLPFMSKGASIINIASIAAFAPNPRMSVYSATKAYVLSYSKSLREELKPLGINCMAVCPGPMRTEFLSVAGIDKGASKTFDRLPYVNPVKVASTAIKKAKRKTAVYTPHIFYKFYRLLAKLLPHSIVMKMSKT